MNLMARLLKRKKVLDAGGEVNLDDEEPVDYSAMQAQQPFQCICF